MYIFIGECSSGFFLFVRCHQHGSPSMLFLISRDRCLARATSARFLIRDCLHYGGCTPHAGTLCESFVVQASGDKGMKVHTGGG